MKTRFLIGVFAFCLGSTAIAQTPGQPPADQTMPPPPQQADPNAQVVPGPLNVPPNAQPSTPAPPDPAAAPGSPGNPVTVGGNATPPPPPQESYPVCKGAVQDRCINPHEAPRAAHKATRHKKRR